MAGRTHQNVPPVDNEAKKDGRKKAEEPSREELLASQMRANLRKRKDQKRARVGRQQDS